MKKRLISMLLAGMMVFSFAGCGSKDTTSDTKKESKEDEIGIVKIGSDFAYPPFIYTDDKTGDYEGFEVEMAKEISKRTGIEIEFVVLPWDGIFGQLDSGKVDTVMECIFPNEERQKKYNFCREYIYDENRFITLKGQGSQYKTYEDLAGKKIGVAGGGNTYDVLAELQKDVDFEIVAYNSENHVNDLALGRLDLIYKSPVSAFEQADSLGAEFELADCPTLEEGSCSLPFRKDDTRSEAICEAFSGAIEDMIKDGTMKKLSEKWLNMDVTCYEPLFDF